MPLTVVTALTLSRLDALKAQCQSWAGPLAAAVYLVLQLESEQQGKSNPHQDSLLSAAHKQGLQEAASEVQRLFDESEASAAQGRGPGGCQLRVLLMYELAADELVASILPINALRNAAMLAAQTPAVAMVDADLLLSSALTHELGKEDRSSALLDQLQQRHVLIMPAFETTKALSIRAGAELVGKAVQSDKAGLMPLLDSGHLQPFARQAYPRGHNCTDFKRWFSTSKPYHIEYLVNCEPWFMVWRQHNPNYDARFRGYGWNKVQQVALVNASGFTFEVHPRAFLVHRPHPRSPAQGIYAAASGGAAGSSSSSNSGVGSTEQGGASPAKLFRRKVAAMRHVALRDMLRGQYTPVLDEGSERCRRTLTWWAAG
eukprot:CAMPEP_0202898276 /NCGR_PEP_ID=MMETSP1392-20130828/6833_1 /ASSEMBLY_ACC=CAM_ASM_000868 /TAXON_ID=225041 /ORGANISM="Chlamydomonas chlamydogama, Strain SAG 11-48b" /LENGTH=372 /DNA_ID=CAMNT_0049584147 /DNA_START=271 /DNA_END=1389 /DNA_ORIENTATION=-